MFLCYFCCLRVEAWVLHFFVDPYIDMWVCVCVCYGSSSSSSSIIIWKPVVVNPPILFGFFFIVLWVCRTVERNIFINSRTNWFYLFYFFCIQYTHTQHTCRTIDFVIIIIYGGDRLYLCWIDTRIAWFCVVSNIHRERARKRQHVVLALNYISNISSVQWVDVYTIEYCL